MKQRKSFGSICAIACAAATIITFASCSQEDEYYESDMFTRAESASDLSRLEAPPTYIPDAQNCGLWVLTEQGVSMDSVKNIAKSKGWKEGNRLTNFLVFDIAQQLYGFSTHIQGTEATNALIRFSASQSLPSRIFIYTDGGDESHIARAIGFRGTEVRYMDYSGEDGWSIYDVFGLMY